MTRGCSETGLLQASKLSHHAEINTATGEEPLKRELPTLGQNRLMSLSVGYLGLQITFGIESASLSRVYQGFGAGVDDLALLWLAGPVSGLLVQPVMGRLSDLTWTRFGRRRPWMLGAGAIATAALAAIAYAPSLAWAIAMVWLLEIAMNALNAPYRALSRTNWR